MMKIMLCNKKSSIINGTGDDHRRDVGRHRNTAWNWKVLRLALLWTRKGGVFKRRLVMEVRDVVFPKLLKSLANYYAALRHLYMQHAASDHRLRHDGHHHYNHSIHYYFERQLSFDKTPIFPSSLKLQYRRPSKSKSNSMRFINIPCLNPPLVLHDFDHLQFHEYGSEVDFMINNHDDQLDTDQYDHENDEDEEEEEESVDVKADEFIAKFYQQIKLQKQISFIHKTVQHSSSSIQD